MPSPISEQEQRGHMVTQTPTLPAQKTSTRTTNHSLRRYFPVLTWIQQYNRNDFMADIIAGLIVAVMLVPQSMAYALLAGLPPQVGLYASIVPLIIYGVMGTSRTLAVGPVAMVSLLVAAGINTMNPQSTAEMLMLALVLALLIGLIQLAMGVLRIGFLVNFLSHPVLSGFTSAAAIVIAFSQLKHILGFDVPRSEHFHEQLLHIVQHLPQTSFTALSVAGLAIAILLYFKVAAGKHLRKIGLPENWRLPLTKLGPLVVVAGGTLLVAALQLDSSISIVGAVPAGLPPLTIPALNLETMSRLLPIALTISLVGYMESISVAKALASKRRQKIDANQELIALGAANIGAAFTGGYPVAGGIGRSGVNFSAGARSGLASVITAGLIALTVMFLTPLFYFLPNAVLAAIIVVAVIGLIDVKSFVHTWHYNRADAVSLVITFLGVLFLGIETGILVGVAVSVALYLWHTSRPHIAIVGRVRDTEHFRNVLNHDVQTYPNLLLVRVDESLYFPNAQYLENYLLEQVACHQDIEHLVLVCSAINRIDASALDVLEALVRELRDAGVTFHLAEVKRPVMSRLQTVDFRQTLLPGRVFLSTHEAVETLTMTGQQQDLDDQMLITNP